ncbi:MAG TPA: hypothetical protein VFB19_18535 [Mycobacterium sp.]|nr:hypothetical protein [Mycobacterium sp.]
MAELGPRGRRMWEATHQLRPFNAAELVLLEELCRMADRLERFDEVLSGDVDVWMRLTHRTRTEDYELLVDDAAAEARQLAATFQAGVKALNLPESPAESKDGIDDLLARRAKRLGA